MKGMLYTEVHPEQIGNYLADGQWVMEQKLDGTRVIAMVTTQGARFLQRGGGVLKHTAATQHLAAIEPELTALVERMGLSAMTVDGELLTGPGTYHLFDVVHMVTAETRREALVPSMPLQVRRAMLDIFDRVLREEIEAKRASVVRQAMTTHEKEEMWEAAKKAGIEGVMLKKVDAPYEPGARVNHGLKVKLVKSADVVVTGVLRQRNLAGRETGHIVFGVATAYEGPEPKFHWIDDTMVMDIGRCSVIGKPHVEVGDVIEVAYLYWTGETTYQPRMVRVREDKRVGECTIEQFPAYSRELV